MKNKLYYVLTLISLFAMLLIAALSEGTEKFIILIASLILGVAGMPLINWIKAKLGWDGTKALLLAYAVAFVVGILAMLLSGELFAIEYTWENVIAIFGVFIAAAKFAYEQFSKS